MTMQNTIDCNVLITADPDNIHSLGVVFGSALNVFVFGCGDPAMLRHMTKPVPYFDSRMTWGGYTDKYLEAVTRAHNANGGERRIHQTAHIMDNNLLLRAEALGQVSEGGCLGCVAPHQ